MPNVGRKGKGSHVQSVVFNKKAGWTKDSSKKWTPLDFDNLEPTIAILFASVTEGIVKPFEGLISESIKAFCKAHGYHTDGHDENAGQHRWRQVDPENGKFRYRTNVIETKKGTWSIMLVHGFPKRSPAPKKKKDKGSCPSGK